MVLTAGELGHLLYIFECSSIDEEWKLAIVHKHLGLFVVKDGRLCFENIAVVHCTNVLDDWLMLYGTRTFLLQISGSRIIVKLSEMLCYDLIMKYLTRSAYHQQRGHTEHYNETVVVVWSHYVSNKQKGWGPYNQQPLYVSSL